MSIESGKNEWYTDSNPKLTYPLEFTNNFEPKMCNLWTGPLGGPKAHALYAECGT